MDEESELEKLLADLQKGGSEAGSGVFTLDPRRALDLLRAQGRVAQRAPLFLLRALYEHTGGEVISWKKGLIHHSLRWPERYGELPPGTFRTLAEAAFEASSIRLVFEPGRVLFKNADPMSAPLAVRFHDTFEQARPRLRFYPQEGLFECEPRGAPWLRQVHPEGVLEIRLLEGEPQAHHFVVDGLEYLERTSLPVNVTTFDDGLAVDLTLTRVTLSQRKELWERRAELALREFLEGHLLQSPPIVLDEEPLPEPLRLALSFLPYISSLSDDDELRRRTFDAVHFRDLFSRLWSLRELAQAENTFGAMLVVPSKPKERFDLGAGARPVLLWQGDTKRFGELVLRQIQSGAGYLFSLTRGGAALKRETEPEGLASVPWNGGMLRMDPQGPDDALCEVKLVGSRRLPETVHLEDAPASLRMVWRSADEVAAWRTDPDFQAQFRGRVVALVERALERLKVSAGWLRELLVWAGVDSLEGMPRLRNRISFDRVGGGSISVAELAGAFPPGTPVPVLEERSASLPEEVPFPILLWAHPLLAQLGFATEEVSSAVRKAYWREEGRKRWLARSSPQPAVEWCRARSAKVEEIGGGHLLGSTGEPSSLVIWREGRVLGERRLREEEFPPGHLLVYVDDTFPADGYWSGPDQGAVDALAPWLERVRRRLAS